MPVNFGGATLTAIIDTRSSGGIGFTPESAQQVEFAGELQVIGSARGAAIPETAVRGGTLAHDVKIGRHTVRAPFATVRALPPGFPTEPILGTVLLRNFVMTFDFANVGSGHAPRPHAAIFTSGPKTYSRRERYAGPSVWAAIAVWATRENCSVGAVPLKS